MKENFYLTTAIAYASGKPHIGNVSDPVQADAIVRYKRMLGFDTYFLTGTDEHGQKIEETAKALGKDTKEHVDDIYSGIKDIWDMMNVSYDQFIRTTDDYHIKIVQKIFKKLYEQDDIYKSIYEGKYCVPDESFFTESQLIEGKCPDCGREVIDMKEEAYFLRLGKYQDRLMDFYNENPDFFLPDIRRKEMVNNFLKPGLNDLCVSRTSYKWGIPVDFDKDHVVYVWIDALSNYITALGYDPDGSSEKYKKWWPADVHVIGKDIVRFHTIYWPIMLMALGEPLPKAVFAHPWLLVGGEKMSKSVGNVLYADDLVKYFGVDAVRYYILSEMPFSTDGTITYESMISKYNSDLANTLGNLVNRTVAMTNRYFDGWAFKSEKRVDPDNDLIEFAQTTIKEYMKSMDGYRNADAVHKVIALATRCNRYIDQTEPWVLAKDLEKEEIKHRLNDVLYNLTECIRILGILFYPFMPETSKKILDQINVAKEMREFDTIADFGGVDAYQASEGNPLFARLDSEKTLAQIQEDLGVEEEEDNMVFLPEITFDDFKKIDLRVAKVTACEGIKKAKKLLKLTLNDGTNEPRTVVSGIAEFYKPEDIIGKSVILVSNLKPAKLMGVESNGMLLAADDEDKIKVVFVEGIKVGSSIN